MKRGGVMALLIIASAALMGCNVMVFLSADREGSEIKLPLGVDTYYAVAGKDSLLEGVTAMDNQDGDVTDSIRVASVLPNSDNTKVTVTYTAKDSSNNVTKLSKMLAYDALNQSNAENADSILSDAGTESIPESMLEASDDEKIAMLPADAPRIYLTTKEVTIPVGSEWHYYNYISDIVDDIDSKSRLSGAIQLDGEVDTSTPGTYKVTYHVTDSNGNVSNYATLTVTVE